MSDLFEGQHGEPCKHDGAMDLRWVCGLCDKALGYSDDKDRVHANELATLKAKHAELVKAVGDAAKCKSRDTVAFSWAVDRMLSVYEARANDQPPGEPPKGKRLLVRVRSKYPGSGKAYSAIAVYHGERSIELHDEVDPFEGCIYDDDIGTYYCPEGWYESPFSDCYNGECYRLDEVISWQELPGEGGEV